MIRFPSLTALALIASVACAAPVASVRPQASGTCTIAEIRAGSCQADGGHGVGVSDSETISSSGPSGATSEGRSDDADGSEITGPPQPVLPISITCRDDVHENRSCLGGIRVDAPSTPAPAAPTPDTPGRSITISDLARFVPSRATLAAEPKNVAVVGLPANFLSTAKTETVPGTILGRALTIRFTPVSHRFDYGDGERRDSATPGVAWESSGQAQFTPTDTSHVYKAPGTYAATVTTTYSAEIDLGAGWIPIDGTLTSPAASQDIRVMKARTALVQNTCAERPSAPGC